MKKFFYSHPDTVIATLVIIFLGILIWFYSWAINDVFSEVHRALTFSPSQSSNSFDLTDAAKLDTRGLLDATSSAAASTPAVTPSVISTTTASTTPASTTAKQRP